MGFSNENLVGYNCFDVKINVIFAFCDESNIVLHHAIFKCHFDFGKNLPALLSFIHKRSL